jgi:pyochelin synthetase
MANREGRTNVQEPTGKPPSIVAVPEQRHVPFPLTDIQQAYWVGRRKDVELGGVTTHYYCEIDCHGLDLERLSLAWQRVVARHDMLRAIISSDGQQRILETVPPYQISITDLRAYGPEVVDSRLKSVRHSMSHLVLPSDRWPLFDIRASLLLDGGVRLHLSFETLVVDARSRNLLLGEWAQFYQDLDLSLPPLEISFRDYVMAEMASKDSDLYRQAQAYWQSRLPTLPPPPELTLATNPDALLRARFARLGAQLDPETWGRLKGHASQRGLRPSVLLLAAFAQVLRAWSKCSRFTINLTLFSRVARDPRLNGVAGDFTSSCLLAIENERDTTFETQALLVQERLMEDLEHSAVSGVEVIRELVKAQGRGFGAVMPVVFTSMLRAGAQNRDSSPTDWLGEVVYAITQTPQVHLDHQVREQKGKLNLVWDAVEELFPKGMLQDMFDSYVRFLHRLVVDEASWQGRWGETAQSLVPPAHLALRATVNATEDQGPSALLQTLFEEQVHRRPEQLAIVASEQSMTYEELYCRANQVGHQLRRLGVQPNTLIAVVMEKGWEQVVAVLGILNAGAAYLPLDPTLPPERLAALLESSEVTLVLTQPCQDEAIEWPAGVQRLCISSDGPDGDASPLTPAQRAEDLAYVIYTSGSTGFPKGVMIEHRGAVNTILDINRRFQVGPDDRVLALASLSFDLSVYDIFGTLAAGGTIVMPEAWGLRDPSHWSDLLSRERVTIWNSVPVLMQLLTEQVEHLPTWLRLVLLSGDWIPLTLPDRIKALGSGVQVISLGGATEGSIWSILYPIDGVDPAWTSIPYGKPMVNQSFHVLDEALAPCPIWVPGQLYIGGLGVARGYWREPEKTQTSFITHPRTGERLYRTGDVGRYLPDANIEFLGREDLQVKIQGYRVELGEIEAGLLQQPGVRAAVVMLQGESHEEKRLTAYIVPESGARLTSAELRFALQKQMPEYMIPTSYVLLDALPLTLNGKIDRQALPDPGPTGGDRQALAAAEQSGLSRRVGSLVSSVLKLDNVAPDTHLLHLGATSVDMIRIANSLERELQFRPRMNDFYQTPTVQGLVALYEQWANAGPSDQERQQPGALGSADPSYQVLRDPNERAAFKARQPGLRRGDGGKPIVQLEHTGVDAALRATYVERRSYRQFVQEPIPFAQFSRWLSCLCPLNLDDGPKYRYGSAGGLYPVQTYLFVKPGRIEGVGAGIYYHHPGEHQLVHLEASASLDPDIYDPVINRPSFEQAAFAVFLIAQLDAIAPMYGERALHYATLEAGLMTQLLESVAPSCGLGLCQIGDLDWPRIRPLFAVDESHVWLHSLLGGSLQGYAPQPWTPVHEPYRYRPSSAQDEFEEGEL